MNDVELVVISIVAETPRYGHEVQQVIDQRGLRQWLPLGFSSVYYVLDDLEQAGLVRGELPFENLRSVRKRYAVTSAGLGALKTQVMDMLTRAKGGIGAFDLAVLVVSVLPWQQVQDALYERRIELSRQIEKSQRALEAPPSGESRFDVETLLHERRLALLEADLDWLTGFEVAWETYHEVTGDDTPPAPTQQHRARSDD